ncbi:hypothetical protein ACE1TI_01595 [Alteribacillus sp. JSM 102045]|uniref:hypothetical protein n=1 Tax=Alteribacillus sp. JSM 102045 TaxID=1562101 RepID=UPI0035C05E3C
MFKGEFTYQTIVKADREKVWEFFIDPKTLEHLTSFPKINVLHGDQTAEGEFIHLRIDIGFRKMDWKGKIVQAEKPSHIIDIGKQGYLLEA